MAGTEYLFSMGPKIGSGKRPSRRALPTGVQEALERLRSAVDGIPPEVMAKRQQAWETLRHATPVIPHADARRHRT